MNCHQKHENPQKWRQKENEKKYLINLWHFEFSKNTFRFFKLSLQLEVRLIAMSSSKSSVQVAEEHSSFAVILRLHGTGPAVLFFDTKKWWISKVDLYALSFFSWWIAMIAIAIDWNFPFWKMMWWYLIHGVWKLLFDQAARAISSLGFQRSVRPWSHYYLP